MNPSFELGNVVMSREGEACYVIAEIGHNHQGNLETAKELFLRAKECGAMFRENARPSVSEALRVHVREMIFGLNPCISEGRLGCSAVQVER